MKAQVKYPKAIKEAVIDYVIERGFTRYDAQRKFAVSLSSVDRWLKQHRRRKQAATPAPEISGLRASLNILVESGRQAQELLTLLG